MKIINDVTSQVAHRYKEYMILPLVAISDNFNFVMTCGKRFVITQDRVQCEVIEYEEKHICQLEDDIRALYGVDAWTFTQKWYNFNNTMDSMTFIKLKLKKL